MIKYPICSVILNGRVSSGNQRKLFQTTSDTVNVYPLDLLTIYATIIPTLQKTCCDP